MKRAQCGKVRATCLCSRFQFSPHQWLCSSLSLPSLGNPGWIFHVTTTVWMGVWGKFPYRIVTYLGSNWAPRWTHTWNAPWNTSSDFWECKEWSVPNDVHSPTMRTKQTWCCPLGLTSWHSMIWLKVEGLDYHWDWVASALLIHPLCPGSVLGSIFFHNGFNHQCLRPWERWEWWMKVVWPICFHLWDCKDEFFSPMPCPLYCILVSTVHLGLCAECIVRRTYGQVGGSFVRCWVPGNPWVLTSHGVDWQSSMICESCWPQGIGPWDGPSLHGVRAWTMLMCCDRNKESICMGSEWGRTVSFSQGSPHARFTSNTRWRRWDQNPPKHLHTGPVSEVTEPELNSF
jgi:hypothetical protein